MTALVLLLGCSALSHAVGRSLRARSAGIAGEDVQDRNLQLLFSLTSNCRADPTSCGSAADTMANFSDNMTNDVLTGINETQQKFDGLVKDFAGCNLATSDSYVSSFDEKVAEHKTCRDKQVAAAKLVTLCETNVVGSKTNKDSQCESPILTTPVADLDDICKPSVQQPLGEWLESMGTQFKTKHEAWQAQQRLCAEAGWAVGNATDECNLMKSNSSAQKTSCDADLSAMESFSCAWATGFATRCSAYETCYAGVLAKYNTAVAALDRSIEQWKQTWTAAKKMQCTSSAISASNVVDAEKMKECNSPNLTDTSFIKVTISAVPEKKICTQPEIYPGSKMYRSKVYDVLPADVEVRLPTLCLSWKGGCAAYSTFAESAVFLKQNGKYCSVSAKGEMFCGGSKGTFAFKHTECPDCCTGNAKLMSLSSGQPVACRFAVKAPAPRVACDSALSNPPAKMVISNNPLATSRSGEVAFEFEAGPAPKVAADTWNLVFRQTMPLLFFAGDWSMNSQDPSNDNYAILDQLEQFKVNGEFKFKIDWPGSGLSPNVWKQTSNPVTKTSGGVEGYQGISVPNTDQHWGGLEYGGTYSLLDGSVNHGNWFYAVGSFRVHNGGYPGPNPSVQKVELYVRGPALTAADLNPSPLTFEVEYSSQLLSPLP